MIIVLMGVAGSGKTTIGRLLSRATGWPFFDGDDFHPPENVAKMARGIPLTDSDRAGWLAQLANLICSHLEAQQPMILACSALKRSYRAQLLVDASRVHFVYLKGDYAAILARLQARSGHYMRPEMLASQFADLEEPPEALQVDTSAAPEEIVNTILQAFWPADQA